MDERAVIAAAADGIAREEARQARLMQTPLENQFAREQAAARELIDSVQRSLLLVAPSPEAHLFPFRPTSSLHPPPLPPP